MDCVCKFESKASALWQLLINFSYPRSALRIDPPSSNISIILRQGKALSPIILARVQVVELLIRETGVTDLLISDVVT